MPLLTDVRDISRIAYGFMASKALFAALNLDLFTRLAQRRRTLEDLAEESGIPPNRLRTLLAACTSLGLIGYEDGRYYNAPASEGYLVAGAPADFADYYRFQIDRQIYPLLAELDRALRGERTQDFYAIGDDSEEAGHFARAQHAGSLGPAHLLAKRLDLGGATRLLDVAGGSGAFSIALCRRNPALHATILDFPNMLDVAAQFVQRDQLPDRIDFLAGDALATEWPTGQDCVLMSYLLYAVAGPAAAELFRRAYDALRPGGLLVVHDFMVDDAQDGPLHAALWLLHGLFASPDAVCLTPAWLLGLARRAGFAQAGVDDLIPGITRVLTARKPAA